MSCNFYRSITNAAERRIKSFLSLGAKAGITDKLSDIYAKSKVNNDVSAEVKFTFPLFFNIKYDTNHSQTFDKEARVNKKLTTQKSKMDLERIKILQAKKVKAKKELKDLSESLAGIRNNEDSVNIINEKINQIKEDLDDEFYEEESTIFDKTKNKYSNSIKAIWFSVTASVPISETKYTIADNYKTKPYDVMFYPISGSARITYIHEWYKYIKYFINVSYTMGQTNTLLDNAVKQSTIETVTTIDSISSVTNTSKAYYSGFKQYLKENLKGQFIFYPKPLKNKYVGFDIFSNWEMRTGDLTWGVGIPLSFKGKDDKSPINFEIIVDKLNQPDRTTVGVSLLLPFSSLIY